MSEQELSRLYQIEKNVWQRGMAWMRDEMKRQVEQLAEEEGEVSPPRAAAPDSSSPETSAPADDDGRG